MRSRSRWDYGFPVLKQRSRLSMTHWMLFCLYLFVVRMLTSQRESLTSAVIRLSLLAVSQRSMDIWVGLGESWIQWIIGCDAAGTCTGGQKPESSGPLCFQSCSTDVTLGLSFSATHTPVSSMIQTSSHHHNCACRMASRYAHSPLSCLAWD